MIVYAEYPKELSKNLLKLISDHSQVADRRLIHKINYLLYASNKQIKKYRKLVLVNILPKKRDA